MYGKNEWRLAGGMVDNSKVTDPSCDELNMAETDPRCRPTVSLTHGPVGKCGATAPLPTAGPWGARQLSGVGCWARGAGVAGRPASSYGRGRGFGVVVFGAVMLMRQIQVASKAVFRAKRPGLHGEFGRSSNTSPPKPPVGWRFPITPGWRFPGILRILQYCQLINY